MKETAQELSVTALQDDSCEQEPGRPQGAGPLT